MATLAAYAAPPPPANASGAGLPTEVEAARYALLRRLGPALRHDLVVHLQAVAMMAEVLSARLARAQEPADLQQALARMHQLARDAIEGALQVAGWITPPEDDAVDLRQGLEESLALVRSSLGFRGIRLLAELPDAGLLVSRDQLRFALLSALLHLSDQGGPSGTLRVQANPEPGGALLRLTLETPHTPGAGANSGVAGEVAQEGEAGRSSTLAAGEEAGYRALRWNDVQVLGAGAPLMRHFTPARIELRLPRARVRAPLQVAPR